MSGKQITVKTRELKIIYTWTSKKPAYSEAVTSNKVKASIMTQVVTRWPAKNRQIGTREIRPLSSATAAGPEAAEAFTEEELAQNQTNKSLWLIFSQNIRRKFCVLEESG